jgi:hypothetical protein
MKKLFKKIVRIIKKGGTDLPGLVKYGKSAISGILQLK